MKKPGLILIIIAFISLFCYSLYAIIDNTGSDTIEWIKNDTISPFPGRSGHKSVVFKKRIWVVGGWNGEKLMTDIWSSDNGTKWTLVNGTASFAGRIGHSLTVFKNKLWLIGGMKFDSGNEIIDFNDIWSSEDGAHWTEVTDNADFSKRGGHSCVVFKGRLYLTGGIDRNGSEVWHTSDGIHWSLDTKNAAFGIRGAHSTVVFNNMIWVIGGMNIDRNNKFVPLTDVWASTDGVNWSQTASNNSSFGGAGTTAIAYNKKLWVIGGFKKSGTVYSSQDGANWQQVNLSADFGERVCHETVVFADRMWVIGGYDGRDHRDDLWYSVFPENKSSSDIL